MIMEAKTECGAHCVVLVQIWWSRGGGGFVGQRGKWAQQSEQLIVVSRWSELVTPSHNSHHATECIIR
jgi:hypothetical protein